MYVHVRVCVRLQGTWKEGIFGLHAVLHKFVIECFGAVEHSDDKYL